MSWRRCGGDGGDVPEREFGCGEVRLMRRGEVMREGK